MHCLELFREKYFKIAKKKKEIKMAGSQMERFFLKKKSIIKSLSLNRSL